MTSPDNWARFFTATKERIRFKNFENFVEPLRGPGLCDAMVVEGGAAAAAAAAAAPAAATGGLLLMLLLLLLLLLLKMHFKSKQKRFLKNNWRLPATENC